MHRRILTAGALGGLAILSACITHKDRNPHNDVLIFGTTTKLGVDVSAPVQNGAVPELTLGYKRLEAVWMPLRPQGAAPDSDDSNLIDNKYASLSSGVDPSKGGHLFELDTYSVFASLGAKGGVSFNSASGNLAQFFATGIAAQRLGTNPSVSEALNATAPEAAAEKATAQAKQAEAEKFPKTVQVLIDAGASPEEAATLASETDVEKTQADIETLKATGCVQAWNKTPPASLTHDQGKSIAISGGEETEISEELLANEAARKAILSACTGGS